MFDDQVWLQGGASRERKGLLPSYLEALLPTPLGYHADDKVVTLYTFMFTHNTLSEDMPQGLQLASTSATQHHSAHLDPT